MALTTLDGAAIFDGSRRLEDHAVVLNGAAIEGVVPRKKIPAGSTIVSLPGGLLASGFIDVQVNGGGGSLLNNTPSEDGIATIAAAHRRLGTTSLLPTLVSDSDEMMLAAIEATAKAVKSVPGVLGLHLEGPHLAPARKGAHLAAMLRPLTAAGADRLVEARKRVGLLLVTLAAEMAEPELIRRLVAGGVVVSLGHSDADYATVQRAIEAGARGGTHLFNAMSQLGHRSPGMIGALLDAGEIWCSIIADGHHVDPAALRTALRAKRPPGRIFLTSDAVALVGAAGDSFLLNGRTVRRHDGRLDFPDGTLAGSDLSMAAAVRYAIANLDVAPTEALRMASLYPAMFLGVESRFGLIAPGFAADLVHLDHRFDVTATWIGGALVTEEG